MILLARLRDDRPEHELVIGAVQDQHRRRHVQRIAGALAGGGLPALPQVALQLVDLLIELIGRRALQRHVPPVQLLPHRRVARVQPRRLGVEHVGDRQHRLRVLEKAVPHAPQADAHVLQADFLADHQERNGGKAVVQLPHHLAEHGGVAHAGVEDPQGRGCRSQVPELHADAVGHDPFFAARGDEQQVLFAVVEKAKMLYVSSGFHAVRSLCGGSRPAEWL